MHTGVFSLAAQRGSIPKVGFLGPIGNGPASAQSALRRRARERGRGKLRGSGPAGSSFHGPLRAASSGQGHLLGLPKSMDSQCPCLSHADAKSLGGQLWSLVALLSISSRGCTANTVIVVVVMVTIGTQLFCHWDRGASLNLAPRLVRINQLLKFCGIPRKIFSADLTKERGVILIHSH